jgi:hypothetical protein
VGGGGQHFMRRAGEWRVHRRSLVAGWYRCLDAGQTGVRSHSPRLVGQLTRLLEGCAQMRESDIRIPLGAFAEVSEKSDTQGYTANAQEFSR